MTGEPGACQTKNHGANVLATGADPAPARLTLTRITDPTRKSWWRGEEGRHEDATTRERRLGTVFRI